MEGPVATLVVYAHEDAARPGMRQRLHRALFGYVDRSNSGRYKYERKGALSDVPHRVLRPGVVLVPSERARDVERLIREHDAWAWTRVVTLGPKDVLKA